MRLDLSIVERYWYSRNKAQAIIAGGLVSVNDNTITKTSYTINTWDSIKILESPILQWVSRSAGKIEGFFQELWVEDLTSKIALDIWSSTWGFTQILLSHDITHVDAVDVGTLQLDDRIRTDKRVTSYENTDIRDFSPWVQYDVITIDVSFISLSEIVPILHRFTHETTDIYALYKPQFEVWKENLRKTGVPRDEKIVEKTMKEFEQFLIDTWYILRRTSKASVIWEAGNQEYMMWIVETRNN